jgi:hypothetical protein
MPPPDLSATADKVLVVTKFRRNDEAPPPDSPADYGLPIEPEPTPAPTPPAVFSKRDFIAGFTPPDYLIDGIIQRGYLYGLTGATGHGKSALALLMASLVGRTEGDGWFGSHAVDAGQVAYLVGENPDDVRARVIGDDAMRGRRGQNDNIDFIPGVFEIPAMRAALVAQQKNFDLVIVDTSAAYFLGNDELSNTQMGAHARMLRTLTTVQGHPAVIVLCHPVKRVDDPSKLLPRGGGAFLAELDGNLTAWKRDDYLVDLTYNKMRGPGFEPMPFRLEKITTTALADSKGRLIPTVRAVPVTDQEEETQAHFARSDEDELLIAMLEPGQSVAELAKACGWASDKGTPYKSKVHRVMLRLQKSGLVKNHREQWQLTEPGKTTANMAKGKTDAHQHEARRYPEQGKA